MSTLVHVSDLHFGGADEAALDAVARYVAHTRPDVVVATGDLALNGRAEELQAAFAWLRALDAPFVATPGNHDVPYTNLLGRSVRPFARYQAAARQSDAMRWVDDACVIVTANTARGLQWRLNWAQGAIRDAQVEEVIAIMDASARPGALRVLATHHPLDWPNDAPIQGRTRGGLSAAHRLAGAHVDLFLSGHLHVTSARETFGGAIAVCGGTLSRRQRQEPCGFAVVKTKDRQVTVDLMHVRAGVAEIAATRLFTLPRRAQREGNPRAAPAFSLAERSFP